MKAAEIIVSIPFGAGQVAEPRTTRVSKRQTRSQSLLEQVKSLNRERATLHGETLESQSLLEQVKSLNETDLYRVWHADVVSQSLLEQVKSLNAGRHP